MDALRRTAVGIAADVQQIAVRARLSVCSEAVLAWLSPHGGSVLATGERDETGSRSRQKFAPRRRTRTGHTRSLGISHSVQVAISTSSGR